MHFVWPGLATRKRVREREWEGETGWEDSSKNRLLAITSCHSLVSPASPASLARGKETAKKKRTDVIPAFSQREQEDGCSRKGGDGRVCVPHAYARSASHAKQHSS